MGNKLKKIEGIALGLFWVIFAAVFAAIIYKVFAVPITHDEPATAVHYNNFSVWEIMMYPDPWPNNHILNTLLAKLSIYIFGITQWSIRLPSLLSFIFYAFGVFRILRLTLRNQPFVFLSMAVLFVANPYLLDFFGLCRGYGMATAFATFSMSFVISAFKFNRSSHIWLALLAGIFAAYANFTLLVFWVAITLISIYYFLQVYRFRVKKWLRPVLFITLISALFAVLIYNPIYKMQSTDQFRYWSSGGFYNETIISLFRDWLYGAEYIFINANVLGVITLIFIGLNIAFLANKLIRTDDARMVAASSNFLAISLLWLIFIINTVQSFVLGTPNLSGRTAVFLYPLLVIALATFFSQLIKTRLASFVKTLPIAAGIFSLFHLVNTFQSDSVREWYFDENTLEVINYIQTTKNEERVKLKTNWHFHPSFNFYDETGRTTGIEVLEYDKSIDPETEASYYYIFAEDYEKLSESFEIEKKITPGRWLLRKNVQEE